MTADTHTPSDVVEPRTPGWGDDLRGVLPAWVAARVLVGMAFLVAAAVAEHYVPGGRATAGREGLFAWDGTWYRAIALDGYRGIALEGVRFFPGYPYLARPFAAMGVGMVEVVLLAVANGASLMFAVVLRRLTRFETGDDAMAERAGWLASLFPAAFVFTWAYAEPMFLVAATGAFFAARRSRWGWALVAGVVAGFTRPLGVVLAAALAVEVLRAWPRATGRQRALGLGAATAPVLATAVYLNWIGRTFGDWQLPFRIQEELRGEQLDVFSRLLRGVGDLFGPERFGDGLHIPFAFAFVALAVVVGRRLPASYVVFTVGVLIAALAADNLNSLERYGLNAFPLLIALAALATTRRREWVLLAVGANGLVAMAALAWLGVYVP